MKLFAFVAVAAISSASFGLDIVVPNVNAANPGPSNQGFPFNAGSGFHYMQVFAASQFGGATGSIKGFSYRVDEGTGNAFGPTTINCDIWFSHTTKAPQGLDLTFANNHGGDKTLVHSGNITVSSAGNPSFFDIFFDVSDTFVYNGSGNLLMEVKVYGGNTTTQFDAAGTSIGAGGTPWTDRLWAFDANAVSGSSEGDDGMVTMFHMNAVPEPASLSALALGLIPILRRRRAK